jgi:copper(I)-binding protein
MRYLLALLVPLAACGADPAGAPEAASDELTIRDAMTVAAPAGGTGGAFMTVVGGPEADTLVAARFAGAERVEVHEGFETAAGLRRMREVEGGIPVPAGAAVRLQPGGYHIMLMGLTAPLAVADTVTVEVEMARAGTVPVRVAVRPVEELGRRAAAE